MANKKKHKDEPWEKDLRDRLFELSTQFPSQAKFAKKIDISESTVSGWFRESKPSITSLIQIADKCNVSLDWLLGLSKRQELQREEKTETTSNEYTPKTYRDVIELIEKWYDLGIAEPYSTTEEPALEPFFDFINPEEWSKRYIIPQEMYSSSIGKHSVRWQRPDVLDLKDTFLACIIIQLYYYKIELPPKIYQKIKQDIIEKYGQEEILNIDIATYDLDTQKILTNYTSYSKVDLDTLWIDLKKLNK